MPQRRGSLKTPKVGEWAFIIGVLLAVVFAIASEAKVIGQDTVSAVSAVLVVLGFVVGLLNVQKRETTGYLIASIALLAANSAVNYAAVPQVGNYLNTIFGNLALLVAPAAAIVALKSIFSLAKN